MVPQRDGRKVADPVSQQIRLLQGVWENQSARTQTHTRNELICLSSCWSFVSSIFSFFFRTRTSYAIPRLLMPDVFFFPPQGPLKKFLASVRLPHSLSHTHTIKLAVHTLTRTHTLMLMCRTIHNISYSRNNGDMRHRAICKSKHPLAQTNKKVFFSFPSDFFFSFIFFFILPFPITCLEAVRGRR